MKKLIVACGSGVATSQTVASKLSRLLKERGCSCTVEAVDMKSLDRYLAGPDVAGYVYITRPLKDYKVPVYNGIAFLTGMKQEEELQKIIGKYTVFGRVSPEKKQAIVKALEAEGNVTGMVGDGVNDVLALKDADCGIAMAAGSDAAKQIAHIVLLDSDFASMKQIVGEGRTIISNIERVSALYLTKTIYSILLCIIYIILRKSYPFIPIQLSLIGGTAIGIPSFVLALEHHEETIPKGFLRNVLRVSLPAAICMVGSLVAITLVGEWFSLSELILSTMHLIAGGIVSFGVLVAVCIPMSRVRFALCLTVIGIFVGAILLLPGFFGMAPIMHLIMTLL